MSRFDPFSHDFLKGGQGSGNFGHGGRPGERGGSSGDNGKDAAVVSERLEPKDRSKVNADLSTLFKNRYPQSIGQGLAEIADVLDYFNLEIDEAISISGDSGRKTFHLQRRAKAADPFTPGPQISNTILAMSWHKMQSGNFEFNAYLS